MPISRDEAAAVARRHGLSLADAAGLVGLADDPADANRIAEFFAGAAEDGEDQGLRQLARNLFGHDDDTSDDSDPPAPGLVPREGHDAPLPENPDRELRRFTRSLFGRQDGPDTA